MKPKFFYGYIIVIAALAVKTVASGAFYGFGVFLKPLTTELGWTRGITSGAYSVSFIFAGSLSIFMGKLNDRFGPRLILSASGLFLGLGFTLLSQISALWQLYLSYGVMIGVGMSAVNVVSLSTVARWFVKRRGVMTGIVVSSIGIGMMVMPLLANSLILTYGWRTSYLILGLITSLPIVAAAQFLRRDPGKMGRLPYDVQEVQAQSLDLQARGLSLREAIHKKQFRMLCGLFMFQGAGQQAIVAHITAHATDLGVQPTDAANILAIIGGLAIVGTVVIGNIADRIGNKFSLIFVLVLLTVVLFSLTLAKGLWAFYLLAAIFGFSLGGIVTVQSTIVAESFGLRAHGAILGAVFFAVATGCAIGPILSGHIFDLTANYSLAFFAFALLSSAALILAFFLAPLSTIPHGSQT